MRTDNNSDLNNSIPSVLAAAAAVERLAAEPDGVAQTSLAQALGLSTSTCYRILRSLAARGWVRKEGRGRWFLSGGLLPVAAALRAPLARLERARDVLERLARTRRIACKLSVRRGFEQVVAVRAEPESPVQATGREGSAFSVAEGSSGAALLADLPDAEARSLFRIAPPSRTGLPALLKSLADLRAKGWCARARILEWPLAALSAPVRDERGAVFASLTFVVPEDRLGDPALPPLLLETAKRCANL